MNSDFDELFDFTREPPPSRAPMLVVAAVATLLVIALVIASIVGVLPDYSRGERVGVVTKLSYRGIHWKSWEGSLNEGGLRAAPDDDGKRDVVPNVLAFSVQDPAVVRTLKEAMNTGRRVKITYSAWLISPVEIDSSYVVRAAVVVD